MNILTLPNISFFIIGIVALLLAIKCRNSISIFFKKYPIRIFFIKIPALIWLAIVILLISIHQPIFNFFKGVERLIPSSIEELLPEIIVALVIFIIFLILYFRKIILSSFKIWRSKPFVLKRYASELTNNALNSNASTRFTKGINKIVESLNSSNVTIYSEHFSLLLGVSAKLFPSQVIGIWNLTWYPLNNVVIEKTTASTSYFDYQDEWKFYFGNLARAYRYHSRKNKNYRFFLHDSDFDIYDLQSNHAWHKILKDHNDWKIFKLYFYSAAKFHSRINLQVNSSVPKWFDFALFKVNIFGTRSSWAIAQSDMPNNDISIVDFSNDKNSIAAMENLLKEITLDSQTFIIDIDDSETCVSQNNQILFKIPHGT